MSMGHRAKLVRGIGVVALLAAVSSLALAGCRGPAFTVAGANGDPACEPTEGASVGEDCDGVFVAAGAASGDGTREAPFVTIAEALSTGANTVYVCGPNFEEAVVVSPGTRLFGGLDCSTWSFVLDERTTITAAPGVIPVTLEGGSGTELEGFRIVSADATTPGGSSIALMASEVSAVLRRVDLVSGNAMAGDAGDPGAEGLDGDTGQSSSGSTGAFGAGSTCGADGGNGGSGSGSGLAGMQGSPTQGNGGSAGCQNGGAGDNGIDGDAGDDSSGIGSLAAAGYLPPDPGAVGEMGSPAGGGGGGGGVAGNGGGAGGSGGCAGSGGAPGSSGGASIAIVMLNADLTFESSTAMSGAGGDGGSAGPGGAGGAVSAGGNGNGTACDGGAGGKGGKGGPGGGGAGGHSILVGFLGSEPSLDGLTFVAPPDTLAGQGQGTTPTHGLAQPTLDFDL